MVIETYQTIDSVERLILLREIIINDEAYLEDLYRQHNI